MNIRHFFRGVLTVTALASATSPVLAGDIYVIAHAGVTIGVEDIRDVFIGDKQIAGSVKLVPMDNTLAQKDFLERVVKIDGIKYANVWTKKGFRDGLNPPALKASDAEILSAVKTTPGAIGYVSSVPAGTKVIKKY
jgi:hypothetical protein